MDLFFKYKLLMFSGLTMSKPLWDITERNLEYFFRYCDERLCLPFIKLNGSEDILSFDAPVRKALRKEKDVKELEILYDKILLAKDIGVVHKLLSSFKERLIEKLHSIIRKNKG